MLYFYAAYADKSMIGSAEKQLAGLLLERVAGIGASPSKYIFRSMAEARRGQEDQMSQWEKESAKGCKVGVL